MAVAASASTAATGDQNRQQVEAARHKPPDKPKDDLDRLAIKKLEEVLAKQERLARQLETLGATTLPNQLHGVQKVLVDAIADLEFAVLDAIGGLELQCTTPDLLPLPAPGETAPYGFCQFNEDNTRLRVRIHNQGGVATVATTTRVSFFGGTVVDEATPALPAFGGAVDLFYDIPANCYPNAGDSECSFVIAADVANASAEGNEANNVATGICRRVG
jgi:hypothetical protein